MIYGNFVHVFVFYDFATAAAIRVMWLGSLTCARVYLKPVSFHYGIRECARRYRASTPAMQIHFHNV